MKEIFLRGRRGRRGLDWEEGGDQTSLVSRPGTDHTDSISFITRDCGELFTIDTQPTKGNKASN